MWIILSIHIYIHVYIYISTCFKNLKNLPSCSISYKVLLSEYSFKKSASNISDFEEQCSYGKKNCWDNFTTSVRSSHLFIFDWYFGWRFRSQTLFFVTSWRKEKNRKYWLSFLFFHGTMTTINIFNTKFS